MRNHFILICCLFLTLWAIRLSTLQSAFQPDDSPETAAAGALPGIQHPPGYPMPTLIGRLAVLKMPGNPAMSQNMAAAFWACLAPCLLFLIIKQLTGDLVLSLWMALGLGLMPQLGYQGSSAKGGIYTLNLCITLTTLSCFWLAHKFNNSKALILGLLIFGFGLSGHYMSLLLFTPALFLWSKNFPKKHLTWLIPGLSIYLYLPLRAIHHPALNWGDPSTLPRLLQTLTRAQYAGGTRTLEGALRLSKHFFSMLPSQILWPVLLCAPLGLYVAWRSRSWQLRPLIYALTLHWLAVVLYNNPPARAPWVIDAFFLPDFTLIWLFGSLGIWSLLIKYSDKRKAIILALGVLTSGMTSINIRKTNYSNDFLAYDYARDLQSLLPKDSILLAAGGGDAFAFWYLQHIEQRRPDLTLLDVPLLSPWYLEELRLRIPELRPEWLSQDSVVNGLLQSQITKPLFYSTHNPGDRGIPFALVSLAPAPNRQVPLTAPLLMQPWKSLRTRFLEDHVTPREGNRDELLAYYPASAQALADFGKRFNSPELIQFSGKLLRQYNNQGN